MRRWAAWAAAALLAAGCGGGGPSSPTAPAPSSGTSTLVVLESSTFDALVLAPARPSLVKFQSPT